MNSSDVVNGDDEQFALLLAHYRDVLNAGRDADPATDPALSIEMQQRLQRAMRCLRPKGHVAVAFSPDGQTLATGDKDGMVRFFDAATGQLRHSRQSHTQQVNCLAFSPDGKTLASAGFDKKVKLFQVTTDRELLTLPEQKDRVRWLAFSPDSAMLATAGHDGILTLFRADRAEPRPLEK